MLKMYNFINILLISTLSSVVFLLINKSYKKINQLPKLIKKHSKNFFTYAKSMFRFENITDNRLNKSFDQNMHTLYSVLGSSDFKYKLPFVMVIGNEKSGKSSLISSLQLEKTIDDLVEQNDFCQWSFFNEAILMEMHSSLFASGKSYISSDETNWNKLLKLLTYHRPEKPIDSLIVTISMKDILNDSINLTNIAEHYYIKIWQMQKKFKINFPIYITITHTDLIPGFSHFANSLNETMQQDIFGWSNPNSITSIDNITFIQDAFDKVIDRILLLQQHLMVNHNISQDGLFVFPFELQKVKDKLTNFIYYIFKRNSLHDNFMLRGIYFTGSARHNAYITHQISQSLQSVEFGSIIEKTNFNDAENILFATTLFKDKIFKEKGLTLPLSRNILDNSTKVKILQYASALMVTVGSYSLVHFYQKIKKVNNELQNNISQIRLTVHNVHVIYKGMYDESDNVILENQAIKLIEHISKIKPDNLFSYFMPPSWFSPIKNDLKFMLGKAYNTVIFQFIIRKFNYELQNIIDLNLHLNNFHTDYVDPFKSNEFIKLSRYINQVTKLENLYYKIKRIAYLRNIEDMTYIMKNLINIDAKNNLIKNKALFKELSQYATISLISLDKHKKAIKHKAQILFEQLLDNVLVYDKVIPNIQKMEELLINIQNKQNYDIVLLNSYFTKLVNAFNKKDLLWLTSRKLMLGEEFNNMIYKIQDSYILGIKMSNKMKEKIYNKIYFLKQKALTHKLPMIGIIFNKNEFGNLIFSKNFQEFQGVLNILAGQEFMQIHAHKINSQLTDSIAKWNPNKLAEIVKVIDEFKNFSNHKILYQRDQANNVMSTVACTSTIRNVKHMLFSSQSQFDNFDSEESLLSNISNNLKETSMYLIKILNFIKSKNPALFTEFKDILQKQLILFLEKLSMLLDRKDLYNITNTNFYIHDEANRDDIIEYLSKQNEQLVYLAELSIPAVKLLDKISNMDHKIYIPIFKKWKEISEEVNKNKEGKSNKIKSIEKFTISYVTDKKECDYLLDSVNKNSNNYFDKKTRGIVYSMSNKCLINNYNVIKNQYRKISDYYNKHLSHKFPFNKDSNTEISINEAKQFLEIWKEKPLNLKALTTYLKREYKWAAFLHKIAKVIPWLEAMINKDGAFLIKLRTNRANEAFGDHIAVWKMMFGKKIVQMNTDFEEIPLENYELKSIIKLSKDSNYTFSNTENIFKHKGYFGIIKLMNKYCISNHHNIKQLKISLPLCDSSILKVWFDIELKGNLSNWPDLPCYAPNFPKGDAILCFK